MEQTCRTCEWWHGGTLGQRGECRKGSPTYQDGRCNCFPATSYDAFCGLWTPRIQRQQEDE